MPFSKKKADKAVNFIKKLKHTKGRWAGSYFNLLPWQEKEIVRPLFGTVDAKGRRQYRFCYVEVPKKNGKSELAGAIALFCLLADGEMGGEVYSAAGDRAQASICFNVAHSMVNQNKTLRKRVEPVPSQKRLVVHKTNSFYTALSAEVFTKHGLNPSTIIFDELHAQPNRDLYDTLIEGSDSAREQQLVFIITTAGINDKTSIAWEVHLYADQVKRGIIEDPTFLPVIYQAGEKEDWEDPAVWEKVNPSFGEIFDLEKIKKHYDQVKSIPARQNNFRRFRLNQWTAQHSRWLPMKAWDACGGRVDAKQLIGRTCYGGLDLSSSIDLTALVLVFPPQSNNEKFKVLCNFYIPEDNLLDRAHRDRVPYDLWTRAGLITPTPGDVVDYNFIRRDVVKASTKFNLQELAYDPWGAVKLAGELYNDDGIEMVEFRQGYKSMSPPTKELLKVVMGRKLLHGGNPVLRWNADNFVVVTDAAENVKPSKEKARERIDGVVALIMALDRAIRNEASPYEQRGLIVL